jgi:hypothetical protein
MTVCCVAFLLSYWLVETRFGLIGYRDIKDPITDRFVRVDFTSDVQKLKTVLEATQASGGGDTPEDIAGGLNLAKKLSWQASSRLLILIADAPCHGTKYHDCDDSYPSGDPTGLDPEKLLDELAKMDVDFYFFDAGGSLNKKMSAIFKGVYRRFPHRVFDVYSMNDTGNFSNVVMQSVGKTVRATKK